MRAATLINIDLITLFFLTQLFPLYPFSILEHIRKPQGCIGNKWVKKLEENPWKASSQSYKKTLMEWKIWNEKNHWFLFADMKGNWKHCLKRSEIFMILKITCRRKLCLKIRSQYDVRKTSLLQLPKSFMYFFNLDNIYSSVLLTVIIPVKS